MRGDRRWRDGEAYRAAAKAFAGIDAADTEGATDAACRVLADGGWTGALIDPLLVSLAADPWFDPPLRVHRDGLRIGAVLFDAPAATITASVLSADALAAAPRPTTVIAPGHVAAVRYHRAAGATLRRWRVPAVDDRFTVDTGGCATPAPIQLLGDGDVIVHDGRVEAHLLSGACADVVTVTAVLRGGRAPVARAFAIDTGALVRSAETDVAQARTAMLLTLLRVSARTDAGAAFEAATHDGGFHLRWAAMREWLALDVAAALPRLRAMADDPHPEVAAAARRMRAPVEAAACRG